MDLPLSAKVVPVQGIGGQTLYLLLKADPVTVGDQWVHHSFLLRAQCPINLLGRDLLQALKARLLLRPEEMTVTLSHGETRERTDTKSKVSAIILLPESVCGENRVKY